MAPTRGNLSGTALVAAVAAYVEKYGNAAGAAVISELPPQFRSLVTPNTQALGLVSTRAYPYPFVGALVDTMSQVVRAPDHDRFLSELTEAGLDASTNLVMSIVLRYGISPKGIARRAQELWDKFHDSGRVVVTLVSDTEYVADISQWPSHDTNVCKLSVHMRRRIIERTGARDVVAIREKCQAWGHDVCTSRVRWR